MWFFHIFHDFHDKHRFALNFTKSYSILRCKLWAINSFYVQKISLYWFGVKFLWLKDCFLLSDKKTYFYMESIGYPYINIQEVPGNYFSLSMNDYTEVLYFIENNGFAHLQNIFFSFCSSIICRMQSFSALHNISG